MSLIRDIATATLQPLVRQSTRSTLSFDDYLKLLNSFSFGGHTYGLNQTLTGNADEIGGEFVGLSQMAYKRNAIVFACMAARMDLFSQARFRYQRFRDGQPDEMFGDRSLSILEEPWPTGTTGDLLARALVYADLAGNAFPVRRKGTNVIRLPRPDWVTMVLGSMREPDMSADAMDAELIGIVYHPGGRNSGRTPEVFLRGEFAHFAPYPDPEAPWRGMSWLVPVVREIQADSSATSHKLKFFEQGATPNMVVSLDKDIGLEAYNAFVDAMEKDHAGLANAYRTLYLGGGAKVEVVGKDLQQLDFKATQGAGETRIIGASGMHPVILPASEGMQGSSLNAGNFAAARRIVADKTLRSLWSKFAGSMQAIVPPPAGSRLWVDEKDIPFLREDAKDRAEILQIKAAAARQLADGGWVPDEVIAAVEAEDIRLLIGSHTGKLSVQLQEPGTTASE